MLGCIFTVVAIATAIAAGLGNFSFWWALIPAFIAGGFSLSNSPGYDIVIQANREGRLGVFPKMLSVHFLAQIALSGAAYWITTAIR
jgi:hypothetical protein